MASADDLSNLVREGNAEALGQLADLNKDKLLAALDRKVGPGLRSKLELEDIYQEVMARAVKDLPTVDFQGQDPIGWLYKVIDRQIVDLHRFHFEAQKRAAGREVSADQPVGAEEEKAMANLLVASMTTPSAVLSRDLKLMRVFKAVEQLSEDMKNAVRWKYVDNLSNGEIAQRLGKTDVATRVLLSRAIRKLQANLSAE